MGRYAGLDSTSIALSCPMTQYLRGDDPPTWVRQDVLEFAFKTGISDAKVIIYVNEFDIVTQDDDAIAMPKVYQVYLRAHGLDRPEYTTHSSWHEVQQRCKHAEEHLDESFPERHVGCEDEKGNPTDEACSFCGWG